QRCHHRRGAAGIHPAAVVPRIGRVLGRQRHACQADRYPARDHFRKQTPYRVEKTDIVAAFGCNDLGRAMERAGLHEPWRHGRDDDESDREATESWAHGWISFVWKWLRLSFVRAEALCHCLEAKLSARSEPIFANNFLHDTR